jgi:hypothetical protein
MRTFGGEPGHQSYAVPPNTKNTLKMTVFRVLTVEGIPTVHGRMASGRQLHSGILAASTTPFEYHRRERLYDRHLRFLKMLGATLLGIVGIQNVRLCLLERFPQAPQCPWSLVWKYKEAKTPRIMLAWGYALQRHNLSQSFVHACSTLCSMINNSISERGMIGEGGRFSAISLSLGGKHVDGTGTPTQPQL